MKEQEGLIQRPRKFPISGKESDDTVWIIFTVKEMVSQNVSPRSKDYIITKDVGKEYKLLAPFDFVENVTHKWEDYENIGTRLGDLYRKYGKAFNELEGITGALFSKENKGGINSILKGTYIESESRKKIDSPLVYNGSDRREYTMIFQFSDQGDTWKDVMQVPTELKMYSSPAILKNGQDVNATNINFPYIFQIKTEPIPFINLKYAAITALQPQYYSPYRNGYPVKCDLTITFRDMSPTYSSSWDIDDIITTDKNRNKITPSPRKEEKIKY